jgi:very-long-chain (3R)-3-hydroxyacyl-CoA dehydratase
MVAGRGAGTAKPPATNRPLQLYLLAYNSAFALGWAHCLASGLRAAASSSSASSATAAAAASSAFFAGAAPTARVLVLACLLETAHAALGLVPSSPLTCFLQWWGRENALFQIALAVPAVQRHPAAAGMVLCWCLSEVIRYPWYAAGASSPRWLTWLRYSAFIPLYPVGVVCELAIIWVALPALRRERLWSVQMPNAANFAFDYSVFISVMALLYPYLFWGQYSSLLRTRAKKLGGGGKVGGAGGGGGGSRSGRRRQE